MVMYSFHQLMFGQGCDATNEPPVLFATLHQRAFLNTTWMSNSESSYNRRKYAWVVLEMLLAPPRPTDIVILFTDSRIPLDYQ